MTPTTDLVVKKGASSSLDPVVAVKELHDAIHIPDAALTIFFCSPRFDVERLGEEIRRVFGERNVIGCTTAGEITPIGYLDGALTGVSIGGRGFRAVTVAVEDLKHFELQSGAEIAGKALAEMEALGSIADGTNSFGFLLVDGLSLQEEALVSTLYRNLGSIQLFGGSAGDGTRFGKTYVYVNGAFRTDAAVFTLVETTNPFVVFKTEHFVSSSEKMVVTKADPARRLVTEINGDSAAREYARMVGLEVDKLTPLIFAAHPVVVKVGGATYVRSIQKVNEDESLTFFCAIDEGIVLTVARGVDMVENLEEAFARVEQRIGAPALVIGCDCILRCLEADQGGFRPRVGELMAEKNVIGFATYGEQFNAMHVNQTFTGVAIGTGARNAA